MYYVFYIIYILNLYIVIYIFSYLFSSIQDFFPLHQFHLIAWSCWKLNTIVLIWLNFFLIWIFCCPFWNISSIDFFCCCSAGFKICRASTSSFFDPQFFYSFFQTQFGRVGVAVGGWWDVWVFILWHSGKKNQNMRPEAFKIIFLRLRHHRHS